MANTDFRGGIPGSSAFGNLETVWLYEGNITRDVQEINGRDAPVSIRSARLKPGDIVEFYDDALFTYDYLGGVPVAKKLASTGTLYYGVIEYIEPNSAVPADATPVTAFHNQMDAGLLRRARVAIPGLQGTRGVIVTVPSKGTDLAVADPTKLKFSKGSGFVSVASGGVGPVPLHHIAADQSVDVSDRVLLAFGMIPMVVVS